MPGVMVGNRLGAELTFWRSLWRASPGATLLAPMLVLAAAAFLAVRIWRLLAGHVLPALRETEAFAGDFAARWEAASQGAARPLRTPAPPAVFTPVATARAAYAAKRDRRHTARLLRRIDRRHAQGQPQRISDLRRAERKGLHHGPIV